MEKADERHSEERAAVEKQVVEKKANFDRSVEDLRDRMGKVSVMTNLNLYMAYIDAIQDFKADLDAMEVMKQEILSEE